MSRETLSTRFWQAAKILRQDDNTNSLLDYVEQISWLLFLKCFEELEKKREDDALFEGKTYTRVISPEYSWSTWTNPQKRLTGQDLLTFLAGKLFPYLRNLKGNSDRSVIRALFQETPSKMLKDGGILRDAIDEINKIDFNSVEDTYTLSYLYESMLAKLGREGGMGGEFYTPRPIIEFVVEMVAPQYGDTVYDPAMGSAGFLVEAYRHIMNRLGDSILPEHECVLQRETFFGQEKKPLPYLLGCMNMILHGVLTPSLSRKNTLTDDVRKFTERDRFNVILTNPPFGGTEHDSVTANFRYPSKATSITFLQHIIAKVKRGGRVGMVIDEGVLFKTNERAYIETKKALLEQFNLHTIISLPAGVFANSVSSGTGPKTDLLFFDRQLNEAGEPVGTKEIWYYDVEAVGFSLTKTQRPLPENDLPDCLKKAKSRAISDRSWVVPVEEIIERGYDLSAKNPNRKDDYEHRPPEAIAADITAREEQIIQILDGLQDVLAPAAQDDGSIVDDLLPDGTLAKDAPTEPPGWPQISLREIVQPKETWNPRTDPRDRFCYVEISSIDKNVGKITVPKIVNSDQGIPSRARQVIRAGDVIFGTTRPYLKNVAVIPPELDQQICSTGFCVLRPRTDLVLSEWIYLACRSDVVVEQVVPWQEKSTYPAVSDDEVLDAVIPLPPVDEQKRIVQYLTCLDFVQDEITKVEQLQKEALAEAAAIVPALLAKAFRGEL